MVSLLGVSYAQSSDKSDSLKTYLALAAEAGKTSDWVASAKYHYAAQRLAEAKRDTQAMCIIQMGLAKMFASSEDEAGLKKAVSEGFVQCRLCRDSSNLAAIYTLNGVLQYKLKALDASAEAFEMAAAIYDRLKDTIHAANVLAKVGNVREAQGRYVEALASYQKYHAIVMAQPETFFKMTANIYLGGSYLYLKRPKEALHHALEARSMAKRIEANYEYGVTLEYEASAYELMGLFKQAYAAQKRYSNFYRDTLINAQRSEQIEALKTQYETAQKESQIALQAQTLKQQRLTLWAIGAVLALVLLGGALLLRLTQQLRRRNTEKEFLIKEIHHRVKNNLQVLSSLLHLQSRQITDETALDAVREGQNRVDAMGLIHQKLYMGDNLASVDMGEYLEGLGQGLLASFGFEERQVALRYTVADLHLDVDTAIPLGLIINELISNALKYAFPKGKTGAIEVALWRDERGKLCLKVSDNGVGSNAAPDPQYSTAFGTKLVQLLSKKLGGVPQITVGDWGYQTEIHFGQ